MEDNFYINLPSNVITHKYSTDNSIANFTTKLPAHISLDGRWEVGLVEMSYTKSWYNLPQKHFIELWYLEKNNNKQFKIVKMSGELEKGNYETIDQLIVAINKLAVDMDRSKGVPEQTPELTVDTKTRVVTIKNGLYKSHRVFLLPDKELCQILGFDYIKQVQLYNDVFLIYNYVDSGIIKDDMNQKYNKLVQGDEPDTHDNVFEKPDDMFNDEIEKPKKSNKRLNRLNKNLKLFLSEQPYDLSSGYHSLFVYCNIVKPSYVGNTYTQLLRLVEIPSDKNFGDQVLITYPNTFYIPLLTQEFETIEIDIKTETGESMPFEFGRSIITLHFRRKS